MILLKLQILNILMILLGVFLFVMLAIFTFYSIIEKERRATIISLILVFIISLPFLLIGLLDFQFQSILSIVLLSLTCLIILLFLLPLGTEVKDYPDIPKLRFDERDVIFSRWKLKKGSKYFEEYYNRHPEKEKVDNKFRAAPGILSEDASKFHPILFPAAKASEDTVDFLRKLEYKPFEKAKK